MTENPDVFVQPTVFIDADHESIRGLVAELGVMEEPPRIRAARLFGYVRDRIRYNPFAPMLEQRDYVASEILARGSGYCVQKAVVLAALCRCAQIPCRICFADIVNHIVPGDLARLMGTNLFTYHGYASLLLEGRWLKATPAFDLGMCEKHGILPVEFDGTSDAVFHPVNRAGEKHIEYVRELGCRADVPFDDIVEAFARVYGKANPELLASWKAGKKVRTDSP